MNKKAQFYILTALILIVIAFALVQGQAQAYAPASHFSELCDNIATESRTTVNQAIYSNEDISDSYRRFYTSFMIYAKTKDSGFGAAYALKDHDQITVFNQIGKDIVIKDNMANVPDKGNTTLKARQTLTIQYDGKDYPMQFSDRDVQVKILAATQTATEKRVKTIDAG